MEKRFDLRGVALAMAIAGLATPAHAALVITEVMSSSTSGFDWFELSNTGTAAVDLSGYQFNDSSTTDSNDVLGSGISIAPGESIVFIQTTDSAQISSFKTSWALTNTRVIGYSGASGGLGSSDSVQVFNAGGTLISRRDWTSHTINVSRTFGLSQPTDGSADDMTNSAADTSVYSNDASLPQGATSPTTGYYGSPGRTVAASNVPSAPVVMSASNDTSGSFDANWSAPSGNTPSGYLVEVSDDNFATLLKTIAVDTSTTVGVSGLSANHSYEYRVRAVNDGGVSEASSAATVTTLAGNTAPTTSLVEDSAYSGVVDDSTDPLATSGFSFTVSDDATAAASIGVTVTSSNTAVVPNDSTHLIVTNNAGTVAVQVVPVGKGYADLTVTLTDDDGTPLSTTRTVHYAASENTTAGSNTRWYSGRSDASTSILLSDGTTMLVGDDEAPVADASGNALSGGNAFSAYSRNASGAPLAQLIPDASLDLSDSDNCSLSGYTGIYSCKVDGEVDIEASFAIGSRVYITGSHSNNKSGKTRPDRWRFFAADVSGAGDSTSLSVVGYYKWLREDLRNWDHGDTHGLGADYFGLTASSDGGDGQAPEKDTLDGFSIEGMTSSPDNSAAWLAFRAPLVSAPGQTAVTAGSASGRVDALIVPVTNFTTLATSADGGTGPVATFGDPIRLDLGGRGIREIRKNSANQYLIIAGPPNSATGTAPLDFRLYIWDGSVDASGLASNLRLSSASLASFTPTNTECSAEGIGAMPTDLAAGGSVDIISDCGDADFYGDGNAAKDLSYNAWKKFRVDAVTIPGLIAQTISFANPGTQTLGSTAMTLSATGGASGNPVVFASQTSDVCATSGTNGTTLDLITTGTCTVQATQAGNDEYAAAAAVTRSFDVTLPSGTTSEISSSGSGDAVLGSGSWVFAPSGSGALQSGGFIATTGDAKSPPSLPSGYTFPYGLFDFVLINGTAGTTATIDITYPAALPAGAVYWKYGPTSGNTAEHWYQLPVVISADRKTVTLSITDGGLGDDDLTANGVIVDQGGPAYISSSVTSVPALSPLGLGLLVSMLGLSGWSLRRRR